jgi:hypothetical protein
MKRRYARINPDYSRENDLGILGTLLLGLGIVTAGGIAYATYKYYQSQSAYQATLPPGTPVTSAGYSAWLQTPAGQASL